MSQQRIAFFLPNLAGGGAERVALNLLKGMLERDVSLDLVVADTEGPYLEQVPAGVRLVNLGTGRVTRAIPALARYLKETKPAGLISHLNHANVAAILAKELARSKTKLVVVEHATLSVNKSTLRRGKFLPPAMKLLYPRADVIVGVSQGVADDLDHQLGFKAGTVKTVYNPVIDQETLSKASMPLEHPWFQAGSPPVYLAVGRFTPEKDFPNLIEAFALVRQQKNARLMILGEGELRPELEAQIESLGISDDVLLPGFVQNPYAYMSNASVFVLSSRWEGLPTVLIEAMACGCSVVATNCPSGPQEILAAGKYGLLVPVEDAPALAAAMIQTLDSPVDRSSSIDRGMYFSTERAVSEYLKLFDYQS
jgi:glycosyltransferase involved in cell wall biosynthesis